MDPEETLNELRALAHELLFNDEDSEEKVRENAVRMAELFQLLDAWIAKGGFLPAAWKSLNAGSPDRR